MGRGKGVFSVGVSVGRRDRVSFRDLLYCFGRGLGLRIGGVVGEARAGGAAVIVWFWRFFGFFRLLGVCRRWRFRWSCVRLL